MIRTLLIILVLVGMTLGVHAQAIQSNGTGGGIWSDPATWAGGVVPTFANGAITIISGDEVVVDTDFTIDQTTVQANATLIVSTSAILSINNGAGTDFIMNGSFIIEGEFILNQGCSHTGMSELNTTFNSGSVYRHRFTSQGVIPIANWDADSQIIIEGYVGGITGTAAGNWSQDFGNFVWNCSAQTGVVNLAGFLTSVNSLTVLSTGGVGILRLSAAQSPTITINNDLSINNNSIVDFSTTGASTIVNIGGNFEFNSTNGTSRLKTSGNCEVNILGDFTMNAPGGTLSLSAGTGLGALNISGNFDLQAGIITESGSGSGLINFTDGTEHVFSNVGEITNLINYYIPSNASLIVTGESLIQGGTGSTLTVDGTLVIQSENSTGAIVTGTGAGVGNVRVTNRIFNSGSFLRYAGSGPQFMGNGQPAVVGLTTVIDNPSGVSLNSSAATVSIGGDLLIENGDLTVELDNLVVDGAITLVGGDLNFITTSAIRTLTSNGSIDLNGGNLSVASGTANANLVINGDITGNGAFTFSGANSNLTFGGSDDLSIDFPIDSPAILENITLSRANNGSIVLPQPVTVTNLVQINEGTLIMNGDLTASNDITMNGGNLVMNATLTVVDDLNMASGATLFFESQTIELRSQVNNTLSGGFFSANESSTLNILGTGVLGTIEFDPAGNKLGNFFIDRSTAGTLVTLDSDLTIATSFTLQNGDFLNSSGLAFGAGAVLTRNNLGAFSLGSVAPNGGPYDLVYIGTGMTTGVEAGGSIANLTSNSTGTINVGGNISVEEDLTVNSGTFTCGANQVSIANLNILTTFNAPDASGLLTITGNIVNNGTFNRSAGTVVFDGNSSILGTNNPSFNNITIDGILTPPTTLNIHGAFTNNGTFNNGNTGTVAFLGTAGTPQLVSGSSVTNFGNINVSNTSAVPDVIIESNQNLHGILTLNTNVVFDADGTLDNSVFTLVSSNDSPTSDASIAVLPASANILGNVTVQRYMSIEGANNGRIYRYISSPVQGAPVSQIQSFIPVTGPFTGSSVCTGCGSTQSMFQYNENVITDTNSSGQNDADDGYANFPASTNTETLATGRGYAIFVRSNIPPVSTAGSALWQVRAPVNRGTVSFNSVVSFTSSGNVLNDGWNLVGNPYPSTIDWDAATGWTRTNVANAIYMRDNAQNPSAYATYIGGVGVNGGSRFIPIGQAFFIKSNGGAINFQANENVKVAGTQSNFIREGSVSDMIRITLEKDGHRDETVVRFSDVASEEYDEKLDAIKLPNEIFNLSSVSGAGRYAINAIPFGACNSTVQLNISNATPGNYQLRFTDLQSFSSIPEITLIDNFTRTSAKITNEGSYAFNVTADESSFGNRFSLLIDQPQVKLNVQAEGLETLCKGSSYSITLTDAESDVNYYASLGGVIVSDKVTGSGNIVLNVSTDKLNLGDNTITIFAQRGGCTALPLNSSIALNVDQIYEIQSVTNGVSCQVGQATIKANGAPPNGHYRWYESVIAVTPVLETIEGSFTTPVLDKSRTYFVAAVNSLGCEGERVEVQAVVENFDAVEISETSYGVLTSNYPTGNKWFFNNELIEGSNTQTITVTQSGLFRVEVDLGACKTTDEFEFVVTGIEEAKIQARAYPNPVVDKLIVQIAGWEVSTIEIISNSGIPVDRIQVKKNSNEVEIDFTDKPSGLYLVKLNSDRSVVSTFKIIKK